MTAGQDGRCPDARIDRGPRGPGAVLAQEPAAVVAVLPGSTGWIDQTLKLHDDDAPPGIRTCVLISQDDPRAMVSTRETDGRLGIQSAVPLEGLEASIEIPGCGVTLPVSVLCEGLAFGSNPVPAP